MLGDAELGCWVMQQFKVLPRTNVELQAELGCWVVVVQNNNPPWSGPNAHPMEDCCPANKTNEKTNPILEHRQGVVVVLNTHGSACLCVLPEMPCGQTSAFTKHSLFPGAE